MKRLKVISKNCVGCEACTMVCSAVHGDQTRESAGRIRVKHRYPDLPTPTFQPMVCHHCEEPECVDACPREALVLNEQSGQVQLIESKCDGCGECVEACPFNAIWVDPVRNVAIKCDLCGGDPQCVNYCNFDAIRSPFAQ